MAAEESEAQISPYVKEIQFEPKQNLALETSHLTTLMQ